MHSRRSVLQRAAVGSSALVSTAGCLGEAGKLNTSGGGSGAAGFDASFTDPRPLVSPQYYAGYDIEVSKASDWITLPSIVPHIAKTFIEQVKSLDGISLDEVDQLTGNTYRQQGIGGSSVVLPVPAGQGLHVRGSFNSGPLVSWLEDTSLERLSSDSSYEWFGRQNKQQYEAFAVGDGLFVYGSRDQIDTAPKAILETELDAFDGNAASTETFAPDVFRLGGALNEGTVRAVAGFAHLPLAADTGVSAFDDVIAGLVGGGLTADLGEEVSVQRTLRYLEDHVVSADQLTAAFDAAANGNGEIEEPKASWTVSTDGQQITGRTTVDSGVIRSTPAFLTRALPAPGYTSLYQPVNPEQLGRSKPAPVALKAKISAGRLSLEYLGGSPDSDLRIRYVHKGSVRHETWSRPFEDGDTFETEKNIDSDTEVWVVGHPDTVNASVVLRVLA